MPQDIAWGAEPQPLQAGTAAVDITPQQFPINMPGGFSANMAESVHDPFFARAVVLSDQQTTIAMVLVDNLGVDPAVIEEAKQLAAAETTIPRQNMLVCSTHTHSGPPSSGSSGAAPEVAYRPLLTRGIADSIIQAYQQLQPAQVEFSSADLPEEVFNRRWFLKPGKMQANPFGKMDLVKMNPPRSPDVLERPAGPTDPEITILSVLDDKQRSLALFANYSLHYVGATPRGQLSADYFGEFSRLMPSRLRTNEKFVAMMSNGTSGDINNIPFGTTRPPRETFEQIRIVAQKAADTAWTAFEKIEQHQSKVSLAMLERKVELKYRRPSEEEIAFAKHVLELKDEAEIAKLPRLADAYARRTMSAAEREEDSVEVILQAIRIGNDVVLGIPFETLVEIGLELKARSPFENTMVIGLANGRYGYLPTPHQHRLGGYETWLGTNWVQEDASDILTQNLTEMMSSLHQEFANP
ncbi:MAG: neutral/alkaline non-lysosomal ceramidase N-terminal domain-containing protein [Planctomycetaceae bacterium]|nr:neutral/alkaline non-lysosomal ceramidase N-terminal domain-containing protein [Planctomycetaceae bacterium]